MGEGLKRARAAAKATRPPKPSLFNPNCPCACHKNRVNTGDGCACPGCPMAGAEAKEHRLPDITQRSDVSCLLHDTKMVWVERGIPGMKANSHYHRDQSNHGKPFFCLGSLRRR